jgi:alpha-tubulin suppressor-like RCC1 family protein
MRPRIVVAPRVVGLALTGLALTGALGACRRPAPSPPIHADADGGVAPPDAGGRTPAALSPARAPSGPLLGAAYSTACVAQQGTMRRFGLSITPQDYTPPVLVTFPGSIARLACGNGHTCAVTEGGGVWCLGDDSHAELGVVATEQCRVGPDRQGATGQMPCSGTPLEVPGLPKLVDVAVTNGTSCGVSEAGEVHCWGSVAKEWLSDARDLPDSAAPPTPGIPPFRVPGLVDVRRIGLGAYFACALDARGEIACWGKNDAGQLGRGSFEKRSPLAERVLPLRGASSMELGDSHACALVEGEVLCWGSNAYHQIDDQREASCKDGYACTPWPRRVTVPSPEKLVALSLGQGSTCVLDAAGAVWCWGRNIHRTLGPGDDGGCETACIRRPRKLLGIPPMTEIANAGFHMCGLSTGRDLVCWGDLESLHLSPGEPAQCKDCVGPVARRPL